MIHETKDSFFTQYGKLLSTTDAQKQSSYPFKDHPQFPALADILSRKNKHHATLCADFSPEMLTIFLEALLHYLAIHPVPAQLQHCELLLLNLENALISDIKQLAIEKEFEALREKLNTTDKYFLIVLSRTDLFSKETKKTDERFLRRQIESLLTHPKCRIILLAQSKDLSQYSHLEDQFASLHIAGLAEQDVMTILKQQRIELEHFHHVFIPEELLTEAYKLAKRYLSTTQTLEKALLLLDSSAARLGALDPGMHSEQVKPVLTHTVLHSVLSDWTQIPVTHLPTNAFRHLEFTQGIQQHLFGQETAVSVLSHELLQAQARLQQGSSPFASFLFAGPKHSGKKTAALALTEQLFKQPHTLYTVQTMSLVSSLKEMKAQRVFDKKFFAFTDVIQQTPYAVLLFDQIEKMAMPLMDGLLEILSTGLYHDHQGNQFDFRQAIIILSTTTGAEHLLEFAEPAANDEDHYTMDLMQLVMSDQKQDARKDSHHYSTQEIIEKIMPDITDVFPLSLCQHVHLVPFLPLGKMAIEKLIRLKLKVLGKELESRHGIELGYAPEVIRYLTSEVLSKRDSNAPVINPNRALKQLYFCVEQAILNQVNFKDRSNQLFLQLNETGQLLRCDWLAAPAEFAATSRSR